LPPYAVSDSYALAVLVLLDIDRTSIFAVAISHVDKDTVSEFYDFYYYSAYHRLVLVWRALNLGPTAFFETFYR
jgi:hypothetical protein